MVDRDEKQSKSRQTLLGVVPTAGCHCTERVHGTSPDKPRLDCHGIHLTENRSRKRRAIHTVWGKSSLRAIHWALRGIL